MSKRAERGSTPSVLRQNYGPPPHEKGPRVFLDYDQIELDAAYKQLVYAPNGHQIIDRYLALSDWTRSRLGEPERLAYGTGEIEKLDLYRTKRPKAPVLVFIHGGGWRSHVARDFAFPAETFVAAGAHFVAPDFAWVQDVGGRLMPLAEQVRHAVAWIHRNAASFDGDPGRIYVAGQSSGGHLAGVVLTTDWPREFGLPRDVVKGGTCISGMYDLKPVRLSARSLYVNIDDDAEEALSAHRHIDQLHAPVIIAYGSYETPEFQRQACDFAAAIRASGKPVRLLCGEHYNHFEFAETLANPLVRWQP